jgi:hypothetical protein
MSHYWFIATPYSKHPEGLDAAFEAAIQARGLLLKHHIPCYSPIVHSHPVAMACRLDPRDLSIWLPAEKPIRAGACGVIMLREVSWDTSEGMKIEWDEFREAGKPVVWMDPGQITSELLDDLNNLPLHGSPFPPPTPVPALPPEVIDPVSPALQAKLLNQSVADIGECLVTLSDILQQGFKVDNEGRRGGIACGLERAAAHVRGERYVPIVDPKHMKNKPGN